MPSYIDFGGDVIVLGDFPFRVKSFQPLHKQNNSHASVITENWKSLQPRIDLRTNPKPVNYFFLPACLKAALVQLIFLMLNNS